MADLLPVHGLVINSAVTQYFRTSDVYGETGGLGAKVSIRKIKDADLTGKETIVPVKELMRTADLMRIGIRYKNSAGKRKSAKILTSREGASKIFAEGSPGTAKLEGETYKIGTVSKGTIVSVGMIRRATAY